MKCKFLKKVMREKGIGVWELSRMTKIKAVNLCLRLWGMEEFKAWEILKISDVLGLDGELVNKIFFG